MASILLALGVILAGQISPLDSRYDTPNTPAQGSPAASPAANGGGMTPLLESPPTDTSSRTTGAPLSGGTPDIYGQGTPFGSGNGSQAGASGSSAPANNSSPPPGYGGLSRPNSFAAPPTSSAVASGPKPAEMIKTMLQPPASSRLAGQPVKLSEVVLGATSRTEQAQRVEAYWDLCSSVSDYYLGLSEQQELQALRTKVSQTDGMMWQQAWDELAVRIGTSQRAALASQYRLANEMGRGTGILPLPGDLPHCGSYRTHYDQIFANRPSVEAQELSGLLPLRYAELKDAAAAVKRTEGFVMQVDNNSRALDGAGTMQALQLLALRRRAFVQIARDYNRRIARYVELATPGEIGADQLIGMLIMRDGTSTATRASGTVPLNRQSRSSGASPTSTYAEGWTSASGERAADPAVKPASAEEPVGRIEERSLLVKPQ